MVAPVRYRAFVAFVTGWLSVFAWLFTTASACIFCAQICTNLATLFHPEYMPTQWQVYLCYVAFVVACTLITIYLPKGIALMETVFFFASVGGFVVFLITVLATSKTKQSAKTVFVTWDNMTGWDDGAAFLIGTGQAMYTFLAVDSASHIAEEVPQPGKKVPQTMCMTLLIGVLTSLPWTLAFMFSIQDLNKVRTSALPIMEVYLQTLRGSKGGAAFLTTWLLFVYFGAYVYQKAKLPSRIRVTSTNRACRCIACTVTSGRMIWAFSRDHGLPFSNVFAKVHKGLEVPVNATIFTGIFCVLYGLIYIGSTTAFNSFIATSILFLNITYAIPQGIALVRGRRNTLPARQFDLGSVLGSFCNIFSVVWVALFTVIFCFPIFRPVTVGAMNYVSVIMAGVFVFMALLWLLNKRKTFTGPEAAVMEGLHLVQSGKESVHVGSKGDE